MAHPGLAPALEEMARALTSWPGIGRRAAERIALHLATRPENEIRSLARTLVSARESIRACGDCGNFTEESPCSICADPTRDASVICVVEGPREVSVIERSGRFRGRYHVLGGLLAPLEGIGRDDLRFNSLCERVKADQVEEVILLLSPSLEGDTTALLVEQEIATRKVRVTRAARGIPSGGDLNFLDEVTLGSALDGRQEFK